jgi:DNA-nicking Smr family endonuclease
MDFGDILDRWEKGQWNSNQGNHRKKGKKRETPKGNRGKPAPGQDVSRLLTLWLETHGVYDKDAEDPAPQGPDFAKRRRLLARRPDAVIDLHGLTRDQAWAALENFFERGRRQGFTKLAVIHGKGNHSRGEAVLKRTVREFIERCPFAGESGQGPAGGTGVTWVLLK